MAEAPGGTRLQFKNPEVIDDCWIDSTDSITLARYAVDYSSYIDSYIIAACAEVNSYCKRYFNKQQADQVFVNRDLDAFKYTGFKLKNKPIVSVDKAWLNVTGDFNEIDLQYLMVDLSSGIIKLLPDVDISSSIITNQSVLTNSTDIWVRFTSGYVSESPGTNEILIPADIKKATALIAGANIEADLSDSSLESFKTQTYSEKSNKSGVNYKIEKAYKILDKYKTISFTT